MAVMLSAMVFLAGLAVSAALLLPSPCGPVPYGRRRRVSTASPGVGGVGGSGGSGASGASRVPDSAPNGAPDGASDPGPGPAVHAVVLGDTHCWMPCFLSRERCRACCRPTVPADGGSVGGDVDVVEVDGGAATTAPVSVADFIAWQASRSAASCIAQCTSLTRPQVVRLIEDPGDDPDAVRRLAEDLADVADAGDVLFWETAIRAGRPVTLAELCRERVDCS